VIIMAGPSIGTWVKVRSKSGGTTPRVLANKYGGKWWAKQGEVITQSRYEQYKKLRADVRETEASAKADSGKPPEKIRMRKRVATEDKYGRRKMSSWEELP
jgi:hypothetical protein